MKKSLTKEKQPTHIRELYDAVNGGDDVDAASEVQEITELMYQLLRIGLESGVFEDAPVFRKDVRKTLKKADGRSK